MPDARPPECPPHCTLKYFKNTGHLDPEKWLTAQPKQVSLHSSCIILGPQGGAMKVDDNEYVAREFEVFNSVPHITLRVMDGYHPKDLRFMMTEAERAISVPLKEHQSVWRSENGQFLKILIMAEGHGQPQTVRMTHESICSAMTDSDFFPRRYAAPGFLNSCGHNIAPILDW